jgi:hypothetical protein
MTATLSTGTNLYSGLRELSNVTNTYAGYFTSNGSAYNLVLPWQADKLEWYNYTKFGTDTQFLFGTWFRDMPAASAMLVNRGTTTLTSTLASTNGVTIANTTGGFATEQLVITGITTATPAVVTTSTPHGYVNGDRVVLTKIIGTIAQQLNNNTYVVQVLSSTTFGLYDIYGLPITTVGTYSSSGQSTLTGPSLGIVDTPISYILTLGTDVVGNNNDVIYFNAFKFNGYFNLGTT